MRCSCGAVATRQVSVGHVLRGGKFRPAWTWVCPECAADAWAEREWARSG